MPLQIVRNDITLVAADAIVNTANPQPVIGGGTDYAIHQAAGPELLEARKQIGAIEIGQAAATPAYRLSAKYVLHTVCPVWIDGQHHEEEELRRAYDAALKLAADLGCRSIAFPLMAAGTYGFPQDLALSTAIRAFTDFLLEHEMQIELVLFNGKAFGIAGSIFDDLKSYIDDHYVSGKNEEEYRIDASPMLSAPSVLSNRAEELRRRGREKRVARPEAAAGSAQPAPMAELQTNERHSLIHILKQHEKTFSESLLDLLRERSGRDSEVYKRAEVSKQLFSKILNNPDYQPTKSTAIQLAIGLQLDLPQTQKFLETAGYALTRSSKSDLVVQYYIERKIYNVTFINEALYDCGLPLLKTGLKS